MNLMNLIFHYLQLLWIISYPLVNSFILYSIVVLNFYLVYLRISNHPNGQISLKISLNNNSSKNILRLSLLFIPFNAWTLHNVFSLVLSSVKISFIRLNIGCFSFIKLNRLYIDPILCDYYPLFVT